MNYVIHSFSKLLLYRPSVCRL